MKSREEVLAEVWRKELKPSDAPWPPFPDDAACAAIIRQLGQDGALQHLARLHQERERLIAQAKANPYANGFDLEVWSRADQFLRLEATERLLAVLGGNRASKSDYAAKTVVRAAVRHPGTRVVCLCQKMETSRQVMQAYVYHYLPLEYKRLNKKNDPRGVYHIRYTRAQGFGEPPRLVLPSKPNEEPSEIVFLTYTQDPADYEGIQLGNPRQPGVLGWWADESLPLAWLTLLRFRSVTCDAKGLWTFTNTRGMTQALAEVIGAGAVVESRPAELLSGRQCVPGIPVGHMPTVQRGANRNTAVVYFHTDENPFSGYPRLKAELEGKAVEQIERRAYGWARATRGRMFGAFSAVNVVKHEQIPKAGTHFMHIDPADARNWFMVWVRVTPDGKVWVVDEWPTVSELGEWAVPTERNPDEGGRGWDGDRGPGQDLLGLGITGYLKLIAERERKLWEELDKADGAQPYVARRTLDRRFGPSPIVMGTDVTCLWQELNDTKYDVEGLGTCGFELAGGPGLVEDGTDLLKTALEWDSERPLDPMRNTPKLFVSERCENVIWALMNYTGRDKQDGASKDPIDCLRDLFTSQVMYEEPARAGDNRRGSAVY